MRHLLFRPVRCAGLLVALISFARAQAPAADPSPETPMAQDAVPGFLVATIKPSDPGSTREGFPTEGHHIACYGQPLVAILSVAYNIHPRQLVDAPAWLRDERFDIEGIPDKPGVPSLLQMQEMYRSLLAERFHLTLHHETRTIPIYSITVAKGGPFLKPARAGEILNAGNSRNAGQRTMRFRAMPMAEFAENLNFSQDKPVIDHTGLPGTYDFTLTWTDDLSREGEAGAPPSLFTAMREQLGLRMDAVKGPADVLIIDHVEHPTSN